MASPTEHISLRLPKALVDELRREAQVEQRSLAWVIARRLHPNGPRVMATVCGVPDTLRPETAAALERMATSAMVTLPGGYGPSGVPIPDGGTFGTGSQPVTLAERLKTDAPDICPACSSPLVPWGPSKRCMKCARNW
jgi:hypothetical protein